jgi:hypothetical protein
VCNGCEYIWTHGGNILDPEDPTKVVIDSPESVAGLATEHSMIEDGVADQSVLQYKEDESHAAFLRGDAVFLRNWPYVYALVANPEESEIKPEQVGITPIPVAQQGNRSYSTLGGWNFFINAASDMQEEGWEFIKWMTAPEQLKTNALQGSKLPTRQSLYDDSEILEKVPVARLGKEAIVQNSTPGRSRLSTRTCRWSSPSSTTPRSRATSPPRRLSTRSRASCSRSSRRGRRSARRARILRFRARPDAGPEEVEEDAQDGEGRDGEDHTRQPGQLSAPDHG